MLYINPITDLDRLKKRLTDKGLVSISVSAYLRPSGEYGSMWWIDIAYKFRDDGEAQSFNAKERNDPETTGWTHCVAQVDEHINSLPTPEEAEHQEFLKLLARVVEKGKDIGVDGLVLNPLIESMKRLSENVITHRKDVF